MFSMIRKIKKKNGTDFYLFGKKIFRKRISTHTILKELNKDFDGMCKLFHTTLEPKDIKPARGILRDIQLSALKILKEIDRVAKENNISYWVDYGTLLGAVRHDGFIPWDDDIDISMPRDDYEKFVDLFNEKTKDPNLKAILYKDQVEQILIKVAHKDAPQLMFVDIFPVDFCYKKMDDTEKLEFSNKLKNLAKDCRKHKSELKNKYNYCLNLRDKKIDNLKPDSNIKPTIFYGLEFYHTMHPYNCFDYDTIFPLKSINFEGCDFSCVNDEDLYLTMIFGDYMNLPQRLHYHNNVNDIDIKDVLSIKRYAKS